MGINCIRVLIGSTSVCRIQYNDNFILLNYFSYFLIFFNRQNGFLREVVYVQLTQMSFQENIRARTVYNTMGKSEIYVFGNLEKQGIRESQGYWSVGQSVQWFQTSMKEESQRNLRDLETVRVKSRSRERQQGGIMCRRTQQEVVRLLYGEGNRTKVKNLSRGRESLISSSSVHSNWVFRDLLH